jgi:hypothetical protein
MSPLGISYAYFALIFRVFNVFRTRSVFRMDNVFAAYPRLASTFSKSIEKNRTASVNTNRIARVTDQFYY